MFPSHPVRFLASPGLFLVSLPASFAALSRHHTNGSLNLPVYGLLALSDDASTMESRPGRGFLDRSPSAADDRPTQFKPASKPYATGYICVHPCEVGGAPCTDNDYWSDSGQVGYVPDSASDHGLDRIQTYADYDHVFATSPHLDWPSGKPHQEVQTREPYYATLFGESPRYPIAMVRNYGMQQNEAWSSIATAISASPARRRAAPARSVPIRVLFFGPPIRRPARRRAPKQEPPLAGAAQVT